MFCRYREGQAQLLDARVVKGANKDVATTSTLTIRPTKENDGAVYRCTVWNRALLVDQKLETSTKINVNCESSNNFFPRKDAFLN